jgi:hypothetical protein
MGQTKTERDDAARAVYFSALASLDELESHEDRCAVVFNWVKYIMAMRSVDITPPGRDSLLPAFAMLCSQFACKVMDLPDEIGPELDMPCGKCKRCKAAGIGATDKPETAN